MATVGLSMIVKNEAHTLRACLESVRGLVSQIVIADTGSTDNTIEVAREFGAKVLSVSWEDHFAKARNAALEPMSTDWVLVLDADEELDSRSKSTIPALLQASGISAYLAIKREYMPERISYYLDSLSQPNESRMERAKSARSYHDYQVVRLFRRDPEIYFFGRVHELIEYRLAALGRKYVRGDVLIHHFGHLESGDSEARKKDYYRRLGRLKVKEEPDNPLAWFELGLLEHKAFNNDEAALTCFERAGTLHPEFVRAWLFAAEIQIAMRQPADALATIGYTEGSSEAVALRERLRGDALHALGHLKDAREAYRRALDQNVSDTVIQGKLGYTEVRIGEMSAGLAKLADAVEKEPLRPELHELLIKAHLVAQDFPAAAEAAERYASRIIHPKTILRAASIRAKLNQPDRVNRLLSFGLQLFPESVELQNAQRQQMGSGV